MSIPNLNGLGMNINNQMIALQSGFVDGAKTAAGIALSMGIWDKVAEFTVPTVRNANATAGWLYEKGLEGMRFFSAYKVAQSGTLL